VPTIERIVSNGRVFCARDDRDVPFETCFACDRLRAIGEDDGRAATVICERGPQPAFVAEPVWSIGRQRV